MRSHTPLVQLALVVALTLIVAACDSGTAIPDTPTPTPTPANVATPAGVTAVAMPTPQPTATSAPTPSATFSPTPTVAPTPTPTASLVAVPEGFTVAFIGDQDITVDAEAVLALIRDEGADMVLHQGDLGYTGDADAWDAMISNALGVDFPYFASVGNHDCSGSSGCSGPGVWREYQAKLQERLDLIDGATCVGDLGVNSACSYNGIFFVLSGIGTLGSDHLPFLIDALASDASRWRICSWHRTQTKMQVGGKGNDTGWDVYEACRAAGAIIATGHEHSYSRTHLMVDFESQIVALTSGPLRLQPGFSFAFVSGLGGRNVRDEENDRGSKPWWGSVYTSTNGATFGALFCEFNHDSVAENARCYFKTIDGTIVDEFDIVVSSPQGL